MSKPNTGNWGHLLEEIDAKDKRIAELEARDADVTMDRDLLWAKNQAMIDGAAIVMNEKDAEIAKWQLLEREMLTAIVAKDKRIAELEAKQADSAIAYGLLFGKNEAMAKLLDQVSHDGNEEAGCFKHCPACAWAKLKEGQK